MDPIVFMLTPSGALWGAVPLSRLYDWHKREQRFGWRLLFAPIEDEL